MKVRDPVCGMTIEKEQAAGSSRYQGKEYYFCSDSCKSKFDKNPARYIAQKKVSCSTPVSSEPAKHPKHGTAGCSTCGRPLIPEEPYLHSTDKTQWTCPMHPEIRQPRPGACPKCGMALEPVEPRVQSKTAWTCPMHPEIVSDQPGSCPICGMALEPKTVSLEEEENPEVTEMTQRFKIGTVLTIPLVYIAMGSYIPAISPERFIPMQWLRWMELILATPVVLWGGWPFFVRGWRSVVTWNPNMFTLIGLGVAIAYLYSLVAALLPGIFPAAFRGPNGEVGTYFEAAAVITTLVLLGQVLELRARSKTGAAIKALLGLAPKTARRVKGGTEEDVPLCTRSSGSSSARSSLPLR